MRDGNFGLLIGAVLVECAGCCVFVAEVLKVFRGAWDFGGG